MIGNRIKELRDSKNLNQNDFGDFLGVSASAISQLERGKTVPSRKLLKSICLQFAVNDVWLETGKGEMFLSNLPVEESREHPQVNETGRAYAGIIGSKKVSQEEHDLIEKVLFVVRGTWAAGYEVSLRQNIDSFYHGAKVEEGMNAHTQKKHKPLAEDNDFKTMGTQRGKHHEGGS